MSACEQFRYEQIDDKPQEACGIVAFAPRVEDPVELASMGIISSHNRGEDAAGIAVFDPEPTVIKNKGKYEVAFQGGALLNALGHTAVSLGHVHYSTDEAHPEKSIQPFAQSDFALAHNGQLTNARTLAKRFGVETNGDSDSLILTKLIGQKKDELGRMELALDEILPQLSGAFSVVVAEKDRLIAARDRRGLRPLNIGRLADGGYGVSSESAVFTLVGGELIEPVTPGTYTVIDSSKTETHRWVRPKPSTCGLEYAYFSRADSEIDGIGVGKARYRMGRNLAEDHPRNVDLVIPMPDSGRHAATGYADQLERPHADGFYRNHDLGRIYIKPGSRARLARLKNNPITEVVRGKKIAVVDDSTIRGDTATSAIKALRESGAREVHWLSAFPQVTNDCYYGMNMRQRDGLIAIGRNDQQIAAELGADSIGYLTPRRFEEAVGRVGSLCMACATGEYPEKIEHEMIKREHISA